MPPNPRARPHPIEEWEAQKDVVRDAYLTQNMTLEDVAKTLAHHHDFVVNGRQLKEKVKAWGFELKKTARENYLAMSTVMSHRDTQGLETLFSVPKRLRREIYEPKQIRKEVVRKTDVPPSLPEAIETLATNRIWTLCPQVAQSPDGILRPSMCATAGLGGSTCDCTTLGEVPCYGCNDNTHHFEEDDFSSPCLTPDSSANATPNAAPWPEALGVNQLLVHTNVDSVMIDSPVPYPTSAIAPQGYKTDVSSRRPEESQLCPLATQEQSSAGLSSGSFDFSELTCSLFSCTSGVGTNRGATHEALMSGTVPPLATIDGAKMRVLEWAAPYFEQHHASTVSEIDIEQVKLAAGEKLRYMLKRDPDNQYIYPCIIWMSVICLFNNKTRDMIAFLAASCNVIDSDENLRKSLVHANSFRYLLAVFTKDEAGVERYGSHCHRSHAQISTLWGPDHPNSIVSLFLWAWHLLESNRYDEAIWPLTDCLQRAERTLGAHDIITIGCLNNLARAYSNTNQATRASDALETAMKRLEVLLDSLPSRQSWDLNPLYLTLSQRLAEHKISANDLASAELLLDQALHGRIRYYGIDHGYTWSTIEILCQLLVRAGRPTEAEQRRQRCLAQLNQARDDAWHQEHGLIVRRQRYWSE
jgi:tetratricopeptide (TPR) repeat protein